MAFEFVTIQDTYGHAGVLDSLTATLIPNETSKRIISLEPTTGSNEISAASAEAFTVFGEFSVEDERRPGTHRMQPAVAKLLGTKSSSEQRMQLFLEALVMRQMDHRNIQQLLAVATIDDITAIYLESYDQDVLSYLRATQPIYSAQLMLSVGIANGVHYLSSIGYVHRGLCAKNIFLTIHSVPKIGCFDHSVDFFTEQQFVSSIFFLLCYVCCLLNL